MARVRMRVRTEVRVMVSAWSKAGDMTGSKGR